MLSFIKSFFGSHDFSPIVRAIGSFEPEFSGLSDSFLRSRSEELRTRVQEGGAQLDAVLPEAFALVREAAKRTLKQRHFDTQLIGGIVLYQGKIAEMGTGEGKTLSATAPAYLRALTGRGVHVITVNDYLARRDAVWMGQIYDLLGIRVACLTHESAYVYDPSYVGEALAVSDGHVSEEKDKEVDTMGSFKVVNEFLRPISRREAYACDIVYGTNHEFGFDYLRDNLAHDVTQQVQRGHAYAIIDEVDSILIDEARTPLIIAAPDTESSEYYKVFAEVVRRLTVGEDYLLDEKLKTVSITNQGIDNVEKMLTITNIYAPEHLRLTHYLEESLRARGLFQRDKHYVVKNGEVIIVDEFTGRLMHGRRYSGGLHQAIEAKEGVVVRQESRTFAQITIQNYFRMYEVIAGMTGTAQTSAEEFHKVYTLDVISVPPNKPAQRTDAPDAIYKHTKAKYKAIAEEVRVRHYKGQPVLIGTASIQNNELISGLLKQAGISHEVLNAKNHEREGAIIAQAGKIGAVTVATNMAGRGVDIILGGNPADPLEAQKVRELGGLHIIGTDRHEARRIDNQLRGRAGRQGDPGSSQFFLSLEDDLMRIFGGERIKSLMETFNLPEDQPIESGMVSRVVNEAQKKVEGYHFDSRKHVLEYDDVLNKQRTAIYTKRQELLQQNVSPQILSMLDVLWMNHLQSMEALRESIGMRAYAQKEPLVEYKRESFYLFKDLLAQFEKWVEENKERIENEARMPKQDVAQKPIVSVPSHAGKEPGRNDPCWCGSGKKFKKCHGK